jgi:hypothetical protein
VKCIISNRRSPSQQFESLLTNQVVHGEAGAVTMLPMMRPKWVLDALSGYVHDCMPYPVPSQARITPAVQLNLYHRNAP